MRNFLTNWLYHEIWKGCSEKISDTLALPWNMAAGQQNNKYQFWYISEITLIILQCPASHQGMDKNCEGFVCWKNTAISQNFLVDHVIGYRLRWFFSQCISPYIALLWMFHGYFVSYDWLPESWVNMKKGIHVQCVQRPKLADVLSPWDSLQSIW